MGFWSTLFGFLGWRSSKRQEKLLRDIRDEMRHETSGVASSPVEQATPMTVPESPLEEDVKAQEARIRAVEDQLTQAFAALDKNADGLAQRHFKQAVDLWPDHKSRLQDRLVEDWYRRLSDEGRLRAAAFALAWSTELKDEMSDISDKEYSLDCYHLAEGAIRRHMTGLTEEILRLMEQREWWLRLARVVFYEHALELVREGQRRVWWQRELEEDHLDTEQQLKAAHDRGETFWALVPDPIDILCRLARVAAEAGDLEYADGLLERALAQPMDDSPVPPELPSGGFHTCRQTAVWEVAATYEELVSIANKFGKRDLASQFESRAASLRRDNPRRPFWPGIIP